MFLKLLATLVAAAAILCIGRSGFLLQELSQHHRHDRPRWPGFRLRPSQPDDYTEPGRQLLATYWTWAIVGIFLAFVAIGLIVNSF